MNRRDDHRKAKIRWDDLGGTQGYSLQVKVEPCTLKFMSFAGRVGKGTLIQVAVTKVKEVMKVSMVTLYRLFSEVQGITNRSFTYPGIQVLMLVAHTPRGEFEITRNNNTDYHR